MAKGSILEPGKSYIFRNYFEMPYEPDDILAEFGYSLELTTVDWPSSSIPSVPIQLLKKNIQRRLPYVRLTSEAARREVLI